MEQHHTGYGSVTPNYGYGKDEGYGSYLSPGPPVPSSYGNDTGNTYTGRYDTFASGYDQPAPTYRPTGSYGAVGEPVKPAGYVSGEFTSQSQERSWQDYDNYGSNTQDYGRDIGNGYDRQVGYSNFSTQENYQQESAPPSYELGQGFNNNRGRPSFSSNQERGSMQHGRGGFDGTDGYTRGGRGAVRGQGRGHYGYEGQFEDVNTGGGQFDSGSSRGRGSRGGHGGIGAGGGDFNSGNRGRGLFDDGNRGRSEFGGDTSGRGQFGGDTRGRPGQFGKDIRGRGQFGRDTRGRGQFGGDTRGRGQFGGLNRGASSGGRGSFGGGQSDRDREQFRGGSRGRGQFVSGNRGRGLFDVNRGRGQVGNTRGRGWVQSGSPRLGQDVSRGTGQYGARGNKQTGNRGRGQQVGVQLGLQEGATRGGLVSRGRGRGDGGGFSTPATKATKPFKMSSADAQGFISYKNNLQEYAQKSHKPIPQYTSQKADIGFAATVSIDGQMYSSLQSQREKKDAEQSAAFEALKALGYIDANDMFSPKLGTSKAKKRPSEDGDVPTPNAKVAKQEQPAPGQAAGSAPGPPPMSYKSKLNERIMKMRLDLPTYNTVRTAGGFMSTLVLNGQVYQGVKACGTKKLAEQHVAEIVFTQLDFKVEATPGEAIVVVGSGSDAALSTPEAQKELSATTSTSSKPPSAPKAKPMKNIVQEYCQKNGMQIPIYSSVKDAGMFIATVTVNGVEYVGTPHIMKKTAEQNAAKKVCEELGLKF